MDINTYKVTSCNYLKNIFVPMNTLTCFNPMCDDPLHKHALDTFYVEISSALYASSYKSIPLVKHNMIIITTLFLDGMITLKICMRSQEMHMYYGETVVNPDMGHLMKI